MGNTKSARFHRDPFFPIWKLNDKYQPKDHLLVYGNCERKHTRLKHRTFFAAFKIFALNDPVC